MSLTLQKHGTPNKSPNRTSAKRRSILPGFGLTMGYTTAYLSLIVLIPLAGLFVKSSTLSWKEIGDALTNEFLLSSLKVTFGLALVAAVVNLLFGFITAWTLVRHPFPGRRFFDALIDLPFALPTAVSGITLATLYVRKGWLGKPWTPVAEFGNKILQAVHLPAFLPEQIAYTQLGMLLAMIFIGVPFMVRTLEPALADLDPETEEAAASLGATRGQSFWRVVLPTLMPAILTGFSLSFARAVGEYGSVIFISSNTPGESEITALMITKKLEGDNYPMAMMLGVVMLVISFLILGGINGLQWWSSRRYRSETA